MTTVRRRLVRAAMRAAARIARRLPWRSSEGVIGMVLTPAGTIVLVRHSYVDGWYPPGGGRRRHETAEAAVIRELREEIGLRSWSGFEPVDAGEAGLDAFVFRDAVHEPCRSLEIEAVATFALDDLPADVSPRLLRLLAAMGLIDR